MRACQPFREFNRTGNVPNGNRAAWTDGQTAENALDAAARGVARTLNLARATVRTSTAHVGGGGRMSLQAFAPSRAPRLLSASRVSGSWPRRNARVYDARGRGRLGEAKKCISSSSRLS